MSEPLSKRQIRNIMRAEQKSAGITKINPGLYRGLIQYLQRMQEAYLDAHAENMTQKALTLTKDIRDTERDISTIYELRERKILLMAQDVVRGGAPSLKYLFPEEKLLLLRLTSILLAMRKDIMIDFHHRVDKYIKTIAKEYDLERKLFSPFHPTDPFCEDVIREQDTPVDSEGPKIGHPEEPAPTDPIPDIGEEGAPVEAAGMEPDDDLGMQGIEVRKDIADEEVIERIEPTVDSVTKVLIEDPGTGESPEEDTNAVGDQTTGEPDPDTEGSKESIGKDLMDEDDDSLEDDEPDASNFRKEYAITGTLDSIPQIRADDLHDYRFETGEIISLPIKMAELLEKQGKLFIVDMSKKQRAP